MLGEIIDDAQKIAWQYKYPAKVKTLGLYEALFPVYGFVYTTQPQAILQYGTIIFVVHLEDNTDGSLAVPVIAGKATSNVIYKEFVVPGNWKIVNYKKLSVEDAVKLLLQKYPNTSFKQLILRKPLDALNPSYFFSCKNPDMWISVNFNGKVASNANENVALGINPDFKEIIKVATIKAIAHKYPSKLERLFLYEADFETNRYTTYSQQILQSGKVVFGTLLEGRTIGFTKVPVQAGQTQQPVYIQSPIGDDKSIIDFVSLSLDKAINLLLGKFPEVSFRKLTFRKPFYPGVKVPSFFFSCRNPNGIISVDFNGNVTPNVTESEAFGLIEQ